MGTSRKSTTGHRPSAVHAGGAMSRRAMLRAVGIGALGLGAGAAVGDRAGLLADLVGGGPVAAVPTSCAPGSRLGDVRVLATTAFSLLGLGGPDVAATRDGGASMALLPPPTPGRPFALFGSGTNGTAGGFGLCGNLGTVMIFEPSSATWTMRQVNRNDDLVGLAGNGAFWVVVSKEGRFWYSRDNGATWNVPANGDRFDYGSALSLVGLYDLEYANGVWMACGFDSWTGKKTFWRSTVAQPTRGARDTFFGVAGGDFRKITGTGPWEWVIPHALAYGGRCQPNPNTWYASGDHGVIWRSTDNGASWRSWRDTGIDVHHGIDVNPTTGRVLCASGLRGVTEVEPSVMQRYDSGLLKILDIAYCGGTDWVASGGPDRIVVSHDDGRTWTDCRMPSGTFGTVYTGIVKPWA